MAVVAALAMVTGGPGQARAEPPVAPTPPPAPGRAAPQLPVFPVFEPLGGLWTGVVDRASTRRTATVIGRGAREDTGRRFGAQGADLGHMFLHEGRPAVVFGDTYGGPPADPFFSVPRGDRRGSTLGWLDPNPDLTRGVRLTDMITDRPGHAAELLGSKKRRGDEETVIPTAGISTGSRMWLHYMSVRAFEAPGRWTLNSSGIAHSDDDGRTWVRDPGAVWPSPSRFGQVAYARPAPGPGSDGSIVYVYGVPAGRGGAVSLARVPAERLGDRAAYRYRSAHGWSSDERDAVDVVPAPAGELSVGYHPYYRRWMMMYLAGRTGQIVLRSAASPTGPWTAPQVVTSVREHPESYAPYLTPMWNDGPDVVFTLSDYRNYRVDLMHTRLTLRPLGAPLPPGARATSPG